MAYFIGGILVGWLLEWLFFTFVMKGKPLSTDGLSTESSNTSALQSQLNAKNKEIQALQAKLADSKSSSAGTSTASSATITGTNTGTASVSKSAVASVTTSKAKSATGKSKSTVTTSKTTVAKKAVKKPTTSTKAATKKPATKVTKSTTAKKPVSKTAPKKAVAKKKPAAKKASSTKTTSTKASVKGDDFTRLSGIGPSMAKNLNDLGIDTYKKLAAMDDDILRDMLEASGARLNNNKEAMDSWNEQATLADKGDFDGLKKLQEALKK